MPVHNRTLEIELKDAVDAALKACYWNSRAALKLCPDAVYVEGYMDGWVAHAWLELNGEIVDVTRRLQAGDDADLTPVDYYAHQRFTLAELEASGWIDHESGGSIYDDEMHWTALAEGNRSRGRAMQREERQRFHKAFSNALDALTPGEDN